MSAGLSPQARWRERLPSPHSVRTRLMLWNMLTLATLLIVLGVAALQLVRSIMLASVDRELVKRAQRFAEQADLRQPPPQPARPAIPREPPDPTRPDAGFDRPQVIDLQGRVLTPADAKAPWDAAAYKASARGEEVLSTVTVQGYPFRVISRAFPPRRPPAGVVQVPYPLGEMNRALAGLGRALLLLLPIALLGAAAGGYALTARALRPVRQMAQVAGRIDAQRLSERLPVEGKDEFWDLAGVINGMLDRLEDAVQRERQFTADASHELRTPLSIIKANTSLCLTGEPSVAHLRRSVAAIDGAADAMARLVQDLLLLARSDAGQLVRRRIELLLADVAREAAARVSAPGRTPITLAMDDDGLCVEGDEDELIRVVTNLLENAQRYTPLDGSITLSLDRRGAMACLTVADTGVGIAPEHLARLGERFYRVDASRSRPDGGAGLGLAIAKTIVEAHGGALEFESAPGQGTTVRVLLPVAGHDDLTPSPSPS